MEKQRRFVLTLLITLIAWSCISQEGTGKRDVVIPFHTAKKIALDLNELDTLRVANRLNRFLIMNYEKQIAEYVKLKNSQGLQVELMKKNYIQRTEMNRERFFPKLWKGTKKLLLYVFIFSAGVAYAELSP